MGMILNILAYPIYVGLFALHAIQAKFSIVYDGILGRRPFDAAVAGQLAGWLLLVILVIMLILAFLDFLMVGAFKGVRSLNEFFAVLNNILVRLIVIAFLYALFSVLTYAFLTYSHIIISEMNNVRP